MGVFAEKPCKECGKLFVPKSARSQYCDRDHYRPCPTCGEPVLIKYLSDPTPRCKSCQKASRVKPKASQVVSSDTQVVSSDTQVVSSDTNNAVSPKRKKIESARYDVRTYIGSPHKNFFEPGHDYSLNIEWTGTGYEVKALHDLTTSRDVNIFATFSSQISINQNFAKSDILMT